MNESQITVRYAKALFQVAQEDNKLDAIKEDLESIQACYDESEDFQAFIENPLLNESHKASIFSEIFKGKLEEISLKFLLLLAEKKRETYLSGICRYYHFLYKAKKGIKEAVITTAQALKPKHKEEITKFINKKFGTKLEIMEEVNPALIGGFKLRIEDQEIDASLSRRLNHIKRELINS